MSFGLFSLCFIVHNAKKPQKTKNQKQNQANKKSLNQTNKKPKENTKKTITEYEMKNKSKRWKLDVYVWSTYYQYGKR